MKETQEFVKLLLNMPCVT